MIHVFLHRDNTVSGNRHCWCLSPQTTGYTEWSPERLHCCHSLCDTTTNLIHSFKLSGDVLLEEGLTRKPCIQPLYVQALKVCECACARTSPALQFPKIYFLTTPG